MPRAPSTFMTRRRSLVAALGLSAITALGAVAAPVGAEDLLQIYREAQKQDPTIAAARSLWEATQERVPQGGARAGVAGVFRRA